MVARWCGGKVARWQGGGDTIMTDYGVRNS